MDRNELNDEIRELSDKINHLNENLSNSKKIHPVEIDLLRLYVSELMALVEQLATTVSPGTRRSIVIEPRPIFKQPIIEAATQEPILLTDLKTTEEHTELEAIHKPTETSAPEPVIIEEPIVQPEIFAEAVPVNKSKEELLAPIEQEQEVTANVEHSVEELKEEVIVEQTFVEQFIHASVQPEIDTHTTATTPEEVTEPVTPPLRRTVAFHPDEQKPIVPDAGKPTFLSSLEETEAGVPSINDRFTQQDTTDLFKTVRMSEAKHFRESMDFGERFLYLKELFRGNQEAFDKATDHISTIATLAEARIYVTEILKPKFAWEDKIDVEKQFMDLLERRFK